MLHIGVESIGQAVTIEINVVRNQAVERVVGQIQPVQFPGQIRVELVVNLRVSGEVGLERGVLGDDGGELLALQHRFLDHVGSRLRGLVAGHSEKRRRLHQRCGGGRRRLWKPFALHHRRAGDALCKCDAS